MEHVTIEQYQTLKLNVRIKLTVVDNWLYTVSSSDSDIYGRIVENFDAVSNMLSKEWQLFRLQNNSEYCDLLELACEYGTNIQDFVWMAGLKPCGVSFKLLDIQNELLYRLMIDGFKAEEKSDIDADVSPNIMAYGLSHNPDLPAWFRNGLDVSDRATQHFDKRLENILGTYSGILDIDPFCLICPTCKQVQSESFEVKQKYSGSQ